MIISDKSNELGKKGVSYTHIDKMLNKEHCNTVREIMKIASNSKKQ